MSKSNLHVHFVWRCSKFFVAKEKNPSILWQNSFVVELVLKK